MIFTPCNQKKDMGMPLVLFGVRSNIRRLRILSAIRPNNSMHQSQRLYAPTFCYHAEFTRPFRWAQSYAQCFGEIKLHCNIIVSPTNVQMVSIWRLARHYRDGLLDAEH